MNASQVPHTAACGQDVFLRLISTTDVHMHIRSHNYFTDTPCGATGLAKLSGLIRQARDEAANALLFDNGDFLQGTPMGDLYAIPNASADDPEDAPHPAIAAMNHFGYDVGNIGNHDLNYGVPFLDAALAKAQFPLVSANLVRRLGKVPQDDDCHFPPYVLLGRTVARADGSEAQLTIGVLGLLPPQVMIWDHDHLAGQFDARDMVETAQAYVPEMRERGADLVIALCHSGIDPSRHVYGMENAARHVAALPGVDAVIAGHQHALFPDASATGPGIDGGAGTLSGKPAVMAGFWGSHLGLIDLQLVETGAGWQVVSHRSELRAAEPAQCADDPDLDRLTNTAHTRTRAHAKEHVGESATPLTTYFALAAPSSALNLIASAKSAAMREVLAGTQEADLPILAAVAPFKCGGRAGPENYTDIAAGALSRRDVASLYPYPNTLSAVVTDGQTVCDWLERAAAVFRWIPSGSIDVPLADLTAPTFNFDTIYGLSYDIDLSRQPRFDAHGGVLAGVTEPRVRNIRLNGQALEPDRRVVVATNNYRSNGGGHFPGTGLTAETIGTGLKISDVIADFLADGGQVAEERPWKFWPIGATAVLQTGPDARAHSEELAKTHRFDHLGEDQTGFQRYRLYV